MSVWINEVVYYGWRFLSSGHGIACLLGLIFHVCCVAFVIYVCMYLSLSFCFPLLQTRGGGRQHCSVLQLFIKRDTIVACGYSQVLRPQAKTSLLIFNCDIKQRVCGLPPLLYHRSRDQRLAKFIQRCVSFPSTKCLPLFCL